MSQLIISYFGGMATVILFGAVMGIRMEKQRRKLEGLLSSSSRRRQELETERAFRKGRDVEREAALNDLRELRRLLDDERIENRRLRQELGDETVFAHTVATGGRAIIRLRREAEVR